jgi:hypothetical protein
MNDGSEEPAFTSQPGERYAKYDTAILGDLDESYYFGASCSACFQITRLSLDRLREELGWYFKLPQVRRRLQCQRCGARQLIISFLTPAQNSGNFAGLFKRPIS